MFSGPSQNNCHKGNGLSFGETIYFQLLTPIDSISLYIFIYNAILYKITMKIISVHIIYLFHFSTESATVKRGQNHEPDTNLNSVFKDGKDLSGQKRSWKEIQRK